MKDWSGDPHSDGLQPSPVNFLQAIRSHPTPLQIYEKRLLEEGVVSQEEMKSITDMVQTTLSSEFDSAKVR